jgi:RHS repeat-associated protein
MARGGSTFFYHQDGLGTVTELTDSAGVTAKSYAYDAWGNQIETTGTVENPYTYTGREVDAETGLSYYRARYYDPRSGRFLQQDPIGFQGGSLNLYAYILNNPTNLIDPLGLWTLSGHRELTTTALETRCFSKGDVKIAVKANLRVDRLTNQLNNPDHYMPGTGSEAKGRIRQWLDQAVARELSGDHTGAMAALGTGLHPVQDRLAHDDVGAGWAEHFLTDPDDPQEHRFQVFEALRESKAYVDEFLERTGAGGRLCPCGQ